MRLRFGAKCCDASLFSWTHGAEGAAMANTTINIRKHTSLVAVQMFNGISAALGGVYLVANEHSLPTQWLQATSFPSYFFPGVILFAIVGGSALISAIALLKHIPGASLMSLGAGVIMTFWIIGEIAAIGELHWLQAIYLFTGIAVVYLTKPDF